MPWYMVVPPRYTMQAHRVRSQIRLNMLKWKHKEPLQTPKKTARLAF